MLHVASECWQSSGRTQVAATEMAHQTAPDAKLWVQVTHRSVLRTVHFPVCCSSPPHQTSQGASVLAWLPLFRMGHGLLLSEMGHQITP